MTWILEGKLKLLLLAQQLQHCATLTVAPHTSYHTSSLSFSVITVSHTFISHTVCCESNSQHLNHNGEIYSNHRSDRARAQAHRCRETLRPAPAPLRNRATPIRSPCRESCSCIHVLRSPSPCSSDTQTHFDAHITQAHMHATHHEWCCCSHDPCAAHSGSPHPLQHAAHWVVHPRSATPVGMHRRIIYPALRRRTTYPSDRSPALPDSRLLATPKPRTRRSAAAGKRCCPLPPL
jgi:hypothetical protein